MTLSLSDIAANIEEQVVVEIAAHDFSVELTSLKDLRTIDIDPISMSLGYDPIGENWREISREEAEELITFHIGHDLAYRDAELRPQKECEQLAQTLFAHLKEESRFFTTYSRGYWSVRRDWTFSLAYILVDSQKSIMVCFLAED
jgi:hypothetical protein